ncbi:FAD-dependent monooxygenase [Actinosynnema sp. NPDC047251]|uniref:Monooxygenase, FAD-binding protein n=1 Tax=Saccharothrix espanaensis (strain ATCC 51144 / DSM 44229 / JCM 9112 / NBRC 15066 / NRRL 15764) TaxID=1179773 RepID=K0JSL2_SACES|nr:FAD-dependent monooxygenase [Saccharothrix espanaensis]CCH28871.1 Monooxygenase, FAD-binding protein [Saccharothrix espanaensis DSM 44229]
MAVRRAVVVGGGLGGLAAAVGLRRIGWDVVVLERAAGFGEVGAGVGVMPNALRALSVLGVADEVRRVGTPRVAARVLDPRGRALVRVAGAGRVVAVHRADLHGVLRAALPASCLVNSVDVSSVESLDGDLVVVADGVRSRLREALFPGVTGPVYGGVTAWRSVTEARFPADLAISQTVGDGVEFGVLPLGDGRVCWYAATEAPEGVVSSDELGVVRGLVGRWHAPIPSVLDSTGVVLRHDIYELGAPLPSYVSGRAVLLGDAAHAMTPYLGQGACMAFEDAVVLAAACDRFPSVEQALAAYDRVRRPRTQAVARASRVAGRMGFRLRNPLAVAARDLALRAMPSWAVVKGAERFTAWRPPVESLDR